MYNPKEYTCEHCAKIFIREARIERYHPVRFCSKRCIGGASRKHGLSRDSFYRKFRSIQQRCEKPYVKSYKNYGGRGIECEWKDFESFYRDMHDSYIEHVKSHTNKYTHLDRMDNNGNYSKKNCRWVTPLQNANNRSNSKVYKVDGEQLTMKELSEKYKISLSTIKARFYVLGWDIVKSCKQPTK